MSKRKLQNGLQVLIIILAIVVLVFLHHFTKKCFLNQYVFLQANKSITEVSTGSFPFYFYEGKLLIDSCDFLLDSGCSSSFVHSDSVHSSINFKLGENINITDFHNQQRSYPLYFTPKLKGRGSFCLKKIIYAGMPYPIGKAKATLGMDVYQNANWYFSFKDNLLTILELDKTIKTNKDAISLEYAEIRNPQVSIQVGDYRIDSVLLDMGMADNDLSLKPSELSRLLSSVAPFEMDSIENVGMNSTVKTIRYTFDNLSINSQKMDSICVIEGTKNAIGINFMRRFDHLFWDSKHQKVYLWNDAKSICQNTFISSPPPHRNRSRSIKSVGK